MAEWLSLTEVVSRDGLATRPVAWRHAAMVCRPQFLADVAAWHAAFSGLSGLRVALYFDDPYEFASALFGAWHAGKEVFLPGDAQRGTTERLLRQVDACAGALPGAMQCTPAALGAPVAQLSASLDLARAKLVVYTSGSSGEPQAIHKTLAQLDAEVRTLQTAFGERIDAQGSPLVYATVSHQHIYGLLFCTLWPLAAGRPFAANRLAYPEQMAATLGSRASVLVSSPAHLKRLPATLDWAAARVGLRGIFSSGGPLPPESAQDALTLMGHSPMEVYGSSETGGIAWRQRALHGDRWNPLPGIDWRVEEELLSVRSAHLPDAAWWQTSDRAAAVGEGGFVLLGRNDRIVKVEEKRVSLTALEAALMSREDVAEARALMLATPSGPKLAAVVVPSDAGWNFLRTHGKRAFNKGLRHRLLDDVERVALPRRFRYVRTLPVNLQGKSTEVLLAALFKPTLPPLQWLARGDARALAVLQVSADLAVFDGHFPDALVLPGVAQLDWAIELSRECYCLPARFLRADAVKFQRPILPPARLELELLWNAAAGQLSFQYRMGSDVCSSGCVVFGEPA